MKRFLFIFVSISILGCSHLLAQRLCGIELEKAAIIAQHPEFAQHFESLKSTLQQNANTYRSYTNNGRTTSTTCAVPVVFHIIVSSAEFNEIGGWAGIQQRVDSQMAVINRDFNRQNSDSVLIPSGWKPLYGNVGIHFGLAHCDPNGQNTPGYEVLITDTQFTIGTNGDYSAAKYDSTGGLNAWDNTRYANVWCINFSDYVGLLGITTPNSFTISGGGSIPDAEKGICILYNALGKRVSESDSYPCGSNCDEFDEGRTLTHEMGHLFEIWHVWGVNSGNCEGSPGGTDDGLADTPPQGESTSGNPTYTITAGTINDICKDSSGALVQPIGIACLSYLDYTDDAGMHLFTNDQAAAMASMALIPPGAGTGPGCPGQGNAGTYGESYSLTQNCNLLAYPDSAHVGVATIKTTNNVTIFPNPTQGIFNISYNASQDHLRNIIVTNIMGQVVIDMNADGSNTGNYSIDLSQYSNGIYVVRCNFISGAVVREVLLQ